jgi:hypothetical protein
MGLGVLTNGRTQEHRYQTCRDESCERFACRVWREGYGAGKADAHAEGYDEGFVDGMAACPGPHTGG